MSGRFFIRKSFRNASQPYNGPTCDAAGVVSRWYDDQGEAQADCDRLNDASTYRIFVVDHADHQ